MKKSTLFVRIGFWSALLCAAGAIGYGIASIIIAVFDTSAISWTTYAEFLSTYDPLPTLVILTPPFIVTLVFPILLLAVYQIVPEERRPLALIALLFAGVYTAVLSAGYWMQLTFIPQSILEGNTAGLELWIIWQPRSFFWSIESFGYFSMGLAGLFSGFSFSTTIAPRRIRWGLISLAPLGFLFMANEALGTWPLAGIMVPILVFGWVILVTLISLWLAQFFARPRLTDNI